MKPLSLERENKLLRRLLADTMRRNGRLVTAVEVSAGEDEHTVCVVITAPWSKDEEALARLIADHFNVGWKTLGEDAEWLARQEDSRRTS